ncbi:Cyclin [Hexamita inflata]|uniref:Cyclin n=1 Tax=Hexamita inflata TaxID=28002 RepID=A0ABP1GSG3_9EUKA
MQPSEVLATYIYIQCKRNSAKPNLNANLDQLFIQPAQQSYADMKVLIGKLCEKLRLQSKQIYQSIRLLEKFCKARDCSLVFNNYYRLIQCWALEMLF